MWWIKRTYITPLSANEVITEVRSLLENKTKLLFFSIREYYGSSKNKEFVFFGYRSYFNGSEVPKLKGAIRSEHPTAIEIRMAIPYFIMFIYLLFPVIFISTFALADEMPIDGVLRRAELWERFFFGFFSIAIPSVIFYFNTILPLQKIRKHLKERLGLKENSR